MTFLWFIDDLFMIWADTEEELLKFINEINQKHKTIKSDDCNGARIHKLQIPRLFRARSSLTFRQL